MFKKKKIRRANETDINDILLSRNYNFNRKFMINKNIIPNLEHYIWWFINKKKPLCTKLMMIIRYIFGMNY